jgi:hypothetical protein
VEYAEDLQTISANPIRDHVGPVGYCPFTGVFDPAFTTHGREQSQFVDAAKMASEKSSAAFGFSRAM